VLADQADTDPPRRLSDEQLPDLLAAPLRGRDLAGWELIDAAERGEGQTTGRARVKLHSVSVSLA